MFNVTRIQLSPAEGDSDAIHSCVIAVKMDVSIALQHQFYALYDDLC